MNKAIVQVSNLFKSYGKIKAADNVSFEVFQGEIFGLVGPNGAGKTTTIECIEGLRKPNSGDIKILGLNLISNSNAIRQRIGIQLQESELPGRIKVWEAMDLFLLSIKKILTGDRYWKAWESQKNIDHILISFLVDRNKDYLFLLPW